VITATPENSYPALIYKFNHRPIKVRVPLHTINEKLIKDFNNTCDFSLDSFIALLKSLYKEDIENHL
jgi:hypothetical protein